jgi:hypothetical protein
LSSGGKLVDPTHLRFNHKKHMPMPEINNNCISCHALGTSAGSSTVAFIDRRYTQPVNYERNCAACHKLKLSDRGPEVTLAHQSLHLVRGQLADAGRLYQQWLAAQSDETRKTELTETVPARPPRKPTVRQISEADWMKKQLEGLSSEGKQAAEKLADFPEHKALATLVEASAASPDAAAPINLDLLEFRVVYTAANRCTLCHDVQGQFPSVYLSRHSASAAASAPTEAATTPDAAAAATTAAPGSRQSGATQSASLSATEPAARPGLDVMLSTIPTGVPTSPRRWFTHSQFNHDAHRAAGCIECHGQALTSSETADVLMPDLATCVRCHHEPQGSNHGVRADCQTCHTYHDRTRDRSPDGDFLISELLKRSGQPAKKPTPATQPVLPPAA